MMSHTMRSYPVCSISYSQNPMGVKIFELHFSCMEKGSSDLLKVTKNLAELLFEFRLYPAAGHSFLWMTTKISYEQSLSSVYPKASSFVPCLMLPHALSLCILRQRTRAGPAFSKGWLHLRCVTNGSLFSWTKRMPLERGMSWLYELPSCLPLPRLWTN